MLCGRLSGLVVVGFLNETRSLVGNLRRPEALLAASDLGLLNGHVASVLIRNHLSLVENQVVRPPSQCSNSFEGI